MQQGNHRHMRVDHRTGLGQLLLRPNLLRLPHRRFHFRQRQDFSCFSLGEVVSFALHSVPAASYSSVPNSDSPEWGLDR